MTTHFDVFSSDAFGVANLTAAINEIDRVPGAAGFFAFTDAPNDDREVAQSETAKDAAAAAKVQQPVKTDSVAIEFHADALTLIEESPVGAPGEKQGREKASMFKLKIPHFPLEDVIHADEVMDVREFGSDEPRSVESVVRKQLEKINLRHDLTLEFLRLGALTGIITGPRGNVLANLFEEFGITNSNGQFARETFDFDLDNWTVGPDTVRTKCTAVKRFVQRNAKNEAAGKGQIIGFAGDEFYDKLLGHPTVRNVYDGTASAAKRLGDSFVTEAFEFGDIIFINYIGTDGSGDDAVRVAPDECSFFVSGVPGLFKEYLAPADFIETVNTPGLPRYAKIAGDRRFNQFVEIHTQQNPLPLCLRPRTLVRGVVTAESE